MSSTAKVTQRPWVLASILLTMFMVAIEATIVATAMPDIVAKLGGFNLYSWVFAAFLLTQTATTVLFGKLSDLYGRRPVLIAGIVVFLVGSVLCGLAHSMVALIAYRLIQGLGAGSILPVATTVVGDLYSPEERASVQGYLSSVWGISAIVGPLAGGLIVERFSWPWVFWMNIPLGILTILGLSTFLHENVERKAHRVDYPGAALFAVAVTCLLIFLTELGQPGGASGAIWLFLAGFLVALPLFVWQERRAEEPMLDLSLWSHRVISSANGATLAAGMSLIGLTTFLAVYVQAVMGESATVAGFALTMMAFGWPVAAALARKFYDRIGMRATLRLGTVLMVAGGAVFLLLNPSSSPVLAGTGSMIMGFGMGLLNVTVIMLVQGSVGWAQRGSATAANVFSRNLGSTLGAAVLGSILNVSLRRAGVDPEGIRSLLDSDLPGHVASRSEASLRAALASGLHLVFWFIVGLSAVTALMALLIPQRELSELAGGAVVSGE